MTTTTTHNNTITSGSVPPEYRDIAPYDDSQYGEKIAHLVHEPGFEHAVRYIMPHVDYNTFVDSLLKVRNQHDFQYNVMGPFLELLVEKTTAGLSCDGLENIAPGESYTFITNHRDIVLDASFLNLCFIRRKMPLTQVAIGNNLLIYDWITDLVKLNRSFIVKRNTKVVEALEAAKHLSAYMHYTLNERGESVWIAQREGRAKDSNDVTQESLIKMISLEPGPDHKDNLLGARLLPVAISYEYDPNDYLKVREFLLKRRDPEFKKSQHDDLFSMETGILQYKGRVHMRIGKCINTNLSADGCSGRAEAVKCACHLIDTAIHCGYRLYPCNYIAYDELMHDTRFAHRYTPGDVEAFKSYVDSQLQKVDVADITADEQAFMRETMLRMYANPLINHLAAGGACPVED